MFKWCFFFQYDYRAPNSFSFFHPVLRALASNLNKKHVLFGKGDIHINRSDVFRQTNDIHLSCIQHWKFYHIFACTITFTPTMTYILTEISLHQGFLFSSHECLATARIRCGPTHIFTRYVSTQNSTPERNIGVYNQWFQLYDGPHHNANPQFRRLRLTYMIYQCETAWKPSKVPSYVQPHVDQSTPWSSHFNK